MGRGVPYQSNEESVAGKEVWLKPHPPHLLKDLEPKVRLPRLDVGAYGGVKESFGGALGNAEVRVKEGTVKRKG